MVPGSAAATAATGGSGALVGCHGSTARDGDVHAAAVGFRRAADVGSTVSG